MCESEYMFVCGGACVCEYLYVCVCVCVCVCEYVYVCVKTKDLETWGGLA